MTSYNVKILLLLILMTSPLASFASTDASDCGFYLEKSHQLGCDQKNYLTNFGYKYCQSFIRINDKLSIKGRKAFAEIRTCLISDLDYYPGQLTCENIKSVAKISHRNCYSMSNFCNISFVDKLLVLKTTWKELFRSDFSSTILQISADCDPNSNDDYGPDK